MKSIFTIIGIVLCSMLYAQTTYTFHTAGNWTDAANWSPSYPGTNIDINKRVYINANCTVNTSTAINLEYSAISVIGSVLTINGALIIPEYSDVTFIQTENNGVLNLNGFLSVGIGCDFSFSNFSGSVNFGTLLQIELFSPINCYSCTFSNIFAIGILKSNSYPFPYVNASNISIGNTTIGVEWINGFIPVVGQNIELLGAGNITGFNPNNFNIQSYPGLNFTPAISANNQSVYIQVTSPLPITYQNQPTAKFQSNQTKITWSVATQLNNAKYIIEHSNDGRNFSPIGEIAGDGTSNETKNYEYIHSSPSIGINYYLIKQVDYDGKYSYSDIASVRYDGNGETYIYPNPTTSEVTITTTASTSLQIMDVYGRILLKQDISEGQNTINLSEFPSGILIFVVGDQRFKVLKE